MGNKHKITIGLFALQSRFSGTEPFPQTRSKEAGAVPAPVELAGRLLDFDSSESANFERPQSAGRLLHRLAGASAGGQRVRHRPPCQTVEGRIVVAQKAGRRSGTSSLGLELTEISLVDGTQLPVGYRMDRACGADFCRG